jgi:hypothetical protein
MSGEPNFDILKATNEIAEDRDLKTAPMPFTTALEAKKRGEALGDSTEKALELRDICLGLIRSLNSLLPIAMLDSPIERRGIAIKSVREKLKKLSESGIEPDMHVNDPSDTFINNPLKNAEFAASQVYFGIKDSADDFMFPKGPAIAQFVLNRKIETYIKCANTYLGNSLGTKNEYAAKR